MNNRQAIVLLSHHPKIGAKSLQKIRACGQPGEIMSLAPALLKTLPLTEQLQQYVLESGKINLNQVEDNLAKRQIKYCVFGDEDFPLLLKELPDAPGIFYYKGTIDILQRPCVALVGSRKASKYGLDTARMLARELTAAGITIVSGLALGIDGAAHEATLESGGKAAAVLGNGLNTIYPSSHYALGLNIVSSGGCLISEFSPETVSYPANFPIRNRIIAGLSQVVIIIEANKKSGSLLTARAALDYNREVMAVPHSLYSPGGEGPNQLIRLGASLITSTQDVLDVMGLSSSQNSNVSIKADSKEEEDILRLLSREPVHVDDIISASGLSVSVINATMILMEMKRIVRHTGNNYYVKNF